MILPDTNLLLYAYDTSNPFHRASVKWWTTTLAGPETVGLCAPVIFGFVRVGTSSRAFSYPMAIRETLEIVTEWFEQPTVQFVETQTTDVHTALRFLDRAGTGANLTTDAQLAAIAVRLQAIVHTADSDYARFPEVRWHNPLLS